MAELVKDTKTPVKYKLTDVNITSLLKPEIQKVIGETKFYPISLVLVSEDKDEKGQIMGISLVGLAHEKMDDTKNRIVYAQGPDTADFRKLIEKLEAVIKDANKGN
jgi:hypothetical protein